MIGVFALAAVLAAEPSGAHTDFHIEQSGVACQGSPTALAALKTQASLAGLPFEEPPSQNGRPVVVFPKTALRAHGEAAAKLFTDLAAPGGLIATKALECGVMEAPVGSLTAPTTPR